MSKRKSRAEQEDLGVLGGAGVQIAVLNGVARVGLFGEDRKSGVSPGLVPGRGSCRCKGQSVFWNALNGKASIRR